MTISKSSRLVTLAIALMIILNSLMPSLALAQSQTTNSNSAAKPSITGRLQNVGSKISTEQAPSLPATIGRIIKIVLSIVGAIFMIYVIYAGFLWLTAAGSEEKISQAKDIIRGSIIGLVIILAAYIITTTVVNRLITATGYKTTTAATATNE